MVKCFLLLEKNKHITILKKFCGARKLKKKSFKNSSCSRMTSLGVGRKEKQRRMRQYHSSNQAISAIDQSPFRNTLRWRLPMKINAFAHTVVLSFLVVQFHLYLSILRYHTKAN